MTTIKPGWKTSEFWMTIVTNLITIIGNSKGMIPGNIATIALVILNGIYTISRMYVKVAALP